MIYEKLGAIQQALKAPKGQYNDFGKYRYRSCEYVLEALKPLLAEHKCVLLLSDNIETAEGRVYVRARATLVDLEDAEKVISAEGSEVTPGISVTAFAREEESKKGMDASQVTGAASSYARKYALNGLFCIDDNKDSDFTNDAPKEQKKAKEPPLSDPLNLFCAMCGKTIDQKVYDYSVKFCGEPLCRECQKR